MSAVVQARGVVKRYGTTTALSGATVDLRFEHLAVNIMPGSGKSEELMDAASISANHIADAVRRLSNA